MSVAGLVVTRDGPVATVILSRPQQRNAVTLEMWQGLARIFTDLARDASLRGVIVTGEGNCFSAGADIAEFDRTRGTPEQGLLYEVAVDAVCDAIAALGRPVIAAINGYCYGGACNIAMACDFRFVAPDAKVAIPAAKLSIVYSVRGMARLLALVGLTEAKRIFYAAQPFDAEHALRTGFADRIDDDPVAAARIWLEATEGLAPLSIAGAKAILNMLSVSAEPFDIRHAEQATALAVASEDYAEGRAAFVARRAPSFTGR